MYRAAYTAGIPGAKCLSPNALFGIFMFQAVTMFVTDVVIIVLPMRNLWNLKLPLKKRIAVMFLFSLGTSPSRRHPAGLRILV